MRLDSVEAAVQEVNFFREAGGKTIVEMSTIEMGRSPQGLQDISLATGVQIIAATGYNNGKFSDAFVKDKSVEQIVDEEVSDLLDGMDHTSIRAGLIKASSSQDQMTSGEIKVFQAAARAHLKTGAPVSTHTEAGTLALNQVRMLTDGGVAPEHIIIGHVDRKLEWDYVEKIAQTGVFMGFDQVSKEKYYADAIRIEFLKRLVESGHGGQILLSGDLARKSYWPSYGFGGGPGLTYILWRFVPWMLEAGIPRQAVMDMLVDNPARALSWATS